MARSRVGSVAAGALFTLSSFGASAGLVTGSVGSAAVTAFDNFLTAPSSLENLEAYSATGSLGAPLGPPTGAPLTLSFVGGTSFSATLDSSGSGGKTSDAASATQTAFNGRHFGPADNVFWDAAGDDFYIEFSTAITAFGFDWADVGDFNGANDGAADPTLPGANPPTFTVPLIVCLSNSATGGAGDLCENIDGSGTDGARGFAGLYDTTPLTSTFTGYKFVRFLNQSDGFDGQAFDNFRVGIAKEVTPPNPTPEPGSIALLGLGLLGLVGLRRRR